MTRTGRILAQLRIAVALAVFSSVPGVVLGDDDPLLAKSREITTEFAGRMQAALQNAMAAGGPVAAIDVCKVTAPQIAADLSADSGATVGRTSLKVRNPSNLPLDWQVSVLTDFDAANAPQEFFERDADGGGRFMKAIPTGALCLNCHGTVLSPEIRAKLDEAYPDDQARGYYLGDIRGAFSVVWEADD